MKIYDVDEAQSNILKRVPLDTVNFPETVLAGTEKIFGAGVTPPEAVRMILTSIQKDGDLALKQWSAKLERETPTEFEIRAGDLEAAYRNLEPRIQKVMQRTAARVRKFHAFQPIPSWKTAEMGGQLGQKITPIHRVGVYVPGGTAPLPSSLLMSVIPAQVAGVKEIIVCTPPDPHPAILAAAYLCGLDSIYQVGGAQAIGAMAFGTETIRRVDKVVGAGGLWVTLAKQQVFGVVGLDGLAGPTETMVIADSTANPEWIAADLLAQAEHDVMATAILLTTDKELAVQVQAAIATQINNLSRAEIILQSLNNTGGIVVVPDLRSAAELANQYAAEHLCISIEKPDEIVPLLRNAGGLFIGEYSFEVLGDYIAGPSHVMPTSGSARFSSPLNVLDFVKITSIIQLDDATGVALSQDAADFARLESLTAHAASADFRVQEDKV